MKTITAVTFAIAATLGACTAHKQPQAGTASDATATVSEAMPTCDIPEDSTIYNPGVLIINYTRTDSVRAAMFAQVKQLNAAVIYDYDIIDAIAVRLPEPHTLSATNRAIRTLKSIPGILNVDRDHIARLDTDR